ncbi:hypothetical protein [Tamlana crocina]|uniref:Uncharacterized protein n=1 Tax=Tamlana crocina TaxID=393006 RepID=A0ABX1DBS9_9FLAO|nr:hypothetical protein [Tamlana crocina]NJX15803.1 hypothetical protein [Tamlana crocina]
MLKNISIYKNIVCFLFICTAGYAQQLNDKIETIAASLQTVEDSKYEYSQSLKLLSSNYASYTLTSVDTKGNSDEYAYNFSFADVDVNTVRSLTKKDVIIVQLLINGKQKLIKETSGNGEKVNYVDNVSFYAKNIDNARNLVEAIKSTIPVNETLEKNKLALTTYQDHVKWLEENIQDVDYTKTQFVQKIEAGSANNGQLKLSTTENSKSKTQAFDYEFNLSTLNPNSLHFKISGDEFYIEATNRRNIKAIKVFEDGAQQNYKDDIRFYCGSIENGKDLLKVLAQAIPLAEKAFEGSRPNIASTPNAMAFLNKAVGNVANGESTYTQSIEGDCVAKVSIKEANPKETTDYQYSFNFSDINVDNIDYNSNKTQLYVEIYTRKKAKFIRNTENNELQNYTDAFKIYFENIEDVLTAKEALKNIAKNCESYKAETNANTVSSGLEALKNSIGMVKIGDDSYDQTFETVSTDPYIVKLTSVFSNLKNSKETIYEFGMGDINSKNISIETSGKEVMVELNTKHLEKIVKTYEDGEIKSYNYNIEIQATDIENARSIASLLQQITEKLE